jgi:hypothetical protein
VSNRFSISVHGIEDGEVVAAVEEAVRQSFDEMALPGAWQITVKPSHVGGRWDFVVQGLDVRHTMSIAVPPRLLPDLIPRRLVESLNRIVCAKVEHTAQRLALRRVV